MHGASGLLVVFLGLVELSQPRPTSSASSFSGPCRAWLFPCGKGSWVCTTEAAYWQFIFGPPPECPSVYPQTTAPPPGECRMVDGGCKFTDSTLTCKAWVDPLKGNKCGPLSDYVAFAKKYGSEDPKGFGQYPPPNQLCLPINNSCEWYDPCLSWTEICTGDNICGSSDDYYKYIYGPKPSCNQVPVQPVKQPGQCAIKDDHCDWYPCASWMGWCDSGWDCGTVYDRDTSEAMPPPSCPVPPPGYHPPPLPGPCKFNDSAQQCTFSPNSTDPCYQPIYPPGFLLHCNALQKQWTYNITAMQCVEFWYYVCGEDRDGYNVFATEEECTKTCIPKGSCSQPIYPNGFNSENCMNILRQWTYNRHARQCVEFNYHFCDEDRDGYDVFATELECINTCMA